MVLDSHGQDLVHSTETSAQSQTDSDTPVFQVPILIPCHRVVCSDGTIGNYSGGGKAVKKWLLAHEGIPTGQPAFKDLGLTENWLKPSFESTSSKLSGRN